MPDLLSLPRELRDDIYELVFRSSLTLKKAHLPRIRISKKKVSSNETAESSSETGRLADDSEGAHCAPGESNNGRLGSLDYYEGEEAIQYPSAKAEPPTGPLLCVNHQIREEMQETIRKKPVKWHIRLAFREDKELLYPTWISMPAFTDRMDTLHVEIRDRKKKTASLFSTASSIAGTSSNTETNNDRNNGDVLFGGFALLQRLLERGPGFVNKKRGTKSSPTPLNIGCVAVQLVPKDMEYRVPPREPRELFDECVDWVDELLTSKEDDDFSPRLSGRDEEWNRINELLHFFAEHVERFALELEGLRREWVLEDAMVERDERARKWEERRQREIESSQGNVSRRNEFPRICGYEPPRMCGYDPSE